jgi:hypothetical protein
MSLLFAGAPDDSDRDSEGERVFGTFEDARLAAQRCRPDGQHDASLSINLKSLDRSERSKSISENADGSGDRGDQSKSASKSEEPPRAMICQYNGVCKQVIWAHDPACDCGSHLTARCADHIQEDCLRCTYRV